MRLPFRRKGKKTLSEPVNLLPDEDRGPLYLYPPTYESAQLVAQLPSNVLQRIFAFVCPHACDESYETCEESASDQGCMLCDLRDLAHCVRTSKQWRRNAVPVLFVRHPPASQYQTLTAGLPALIDTTACASTPSTTAGLRQSSPRGARRRHDSTATAYPRTRPRHACACCGDPYATTPRGSARWSSSSRYPTCYASHPTSSWHRP